MKKTLHLTAAILAFLFLVMTIMTTIFTSLAMPDDPGFGLVANVVYTIRSLFGMMIIAFILIMLRRYFYDEYADIPLRRMFTVLLVFAVVGSVLSDLLYIVNAFSKDVYDFISYLMPVVFFIPYLIIGFYMLVKVEMKSALHRIFAWTFALYGIFYMAKAVIEFVNLLDKAARPGLKTTIGLLQDSSIYVGSLLIAVIVIVLIKAYDSAKKERVSERDRKVAEFFKEIEK
jgi:hypothetical protein